jgi:signal transduction histidine kinase
MHKPGWIAVALAVAAGASALVSWLTAWQTTGIVDAVTTLLPVPLAFALGLWCPRAVGLLATVWMAVTIELTAGYVNPFVLVVTFGPWFVGVVVTDRLQLTRRLAEVGRQLEEESDRLAEDAVRLERARIARELHDVVAHCVSVMVVQAHAGERLADIDRQAASEAFDNINEVAGQARREIVHLVDLLADAQPGPSPSELNDALAALVEGARSTGLDVDLLIEGDGEASERAARVTYRVVQEGLTNALKHAPGSAIGISVCIDRDVRIDVMNGAGVMPSALGSVGGGHGLVGLRQRVSDLGGNLDVGHEDTGAWRLSVCVPAT